MKDFKDSWIQKKWEYAASEHARKKVMLNRLKQNMKFFSGQAKEIYESMVQSTEQRIAELEDQYPQLK